MSGQIISTDSSKQPTKDTYANGYEVVDNPAYESGGNNGTKNSN